MLDVLQTVLASGPVARASLLLKHREGNVVLDIFAVFSVFRCSFP